MTDNILSCRCIQNNKRNWLSPVIANSVEHEVRKFLVCFYLRKLGLSYFIEAIFEYNKGRADIFVTDKEVAIEILESEEEERFAQKKLTYPCRVVAVRKDFEITLDSIDLLVN